MALPPFSRTACILLGMDSAKFRRYWQLLILKTQSRLISSSSSGTEVAWQSFSWAFIQTSRFSSTDSCLAILPLCVFRLPGSDCQASRAGPRKFEKATHPLNQLSISIASSNRDKNIFGASQYKQLSKDIESPALIHRGRMLLAQILVHRTLFVTPTV